MTGTNIAASGIVLEPLTKENYENWSTLVKNYLIGKDLWDVVTLVNPETPDQRKRKKNGKDLHIPQTSDARQTGAPETADVPETPAQRKRKMKNAKALHIIQLACGSQNLAQIRQVKTAKEAWNKLSVLYSTYLETDPEIPQGVVEDSLGRYKKLHMHVLSGEWEDAKSLIDKDDEAIYSKSSWNRTVLHIAVIAGHENIVEELVEIGKDRLIEIQDKSGYTALAMAAELAGNTEIAKYVINGTTRGQDLLCMKTENDEIPVLLSAAKGHHEMTSVLYARTPRKELEDGNFRSGFLLFTRCITAGIFDVALDLLRRTPKVLLAFDLGPESKDLQPLYALACVPSAFCSGSRFGLLQKFIYNILILRSETSQRIVRDDDSVNVTVLQVAQEEGQLKSSFTSMDCTISLTRFCGRVLNFSGWLLQSFHKLVQNSILLKLPGVRKIYNQKKKHLLVGEILSCLQERIRGFDETQLREALAYDAMLQAAKLGIIEFIDEMRKANPNLLWAIDQNKRGIFTHAVMNRRRAVFQLIHDAKVNGRKDIIKGRPDASGNTILHMAAYLGPSSDLDNRFGPALQMQREIQWFKEVESNVHSRCRKAKNPEGKTPRELFKESHKELVKTGEKWAKETAGHFALVGTLIITIMFAAAFTIPGGKYQNDKILTAFIISDALSLFTSSASVLLFIGILTSRCDENDFHKSLPLKLLFGLMFLFLSVAAMVVAFCSSLAMYDKGHRPVKIAAISLSFIPVFVLLLSLRLFLQIFMSTIRS